MTVSNSTTFDLNYGSASLEGHMASDVTCLDTSGDTCAESFEFYVITKSDGLDGMDGILGLSPINEAQNGPSYLSALYT